MVVRFALHVCDECHKDILCFDLTSCWLGAIVVFVGNKPYRTGERMTRKDYKLIAEAIRQTSEYFTDKDAFSDEMRDILIAVGMTAVVRNLQKVLQEDNPNFKSDVFYKACLL